MRPIPREADVVVIGGGITGCATAYYLARRKLRVVLLEKADVASEQSSRAWGLVRQQSRHPAEMPLAKIASVMWGDLSKELEADLEFVRGGILALAETTGDMARIEEGAAVAAEYSLSTRLVTPKEIATIVPDLAGKWQAGLYTPDDGHADPEKATRAFAGAARRQGAVILTRTPATGIELRNGAVCGVHTKTGTLKTAAVVAAAGIWGAQVAQWVGASVPLQIVRSSVAETEAAEPFLRTAILGPYVSFRPSPRGTFILGNGYRGAGGDYDITLASFRHLRYFLPNYVRNWRLLKVSLGRELLADVCRVAMRRRPLVAGTGLPTEPRVNDHKIRHNERRFYQTIPRVKGIGIQRRWAGYIDLTPDLLPVIGELGSPRGLFLATGFSGHGFALGPVVGRLLSELVLDGRSSLDIHPFRATRFVEGEDLRARRVL